jgi:hypothetical protein
MRRTLLLAAALLSGCGDWPDLGIDGAVTGEPALVPFEQVAAPGALHGAEAEAAAEADAALTARSEALRDRAATAGLTPEDRSALDALRARPRPGG